MTSSGTAPQLETPKIDTALVPPRDLKLPCLIHDLNNVFQTLIEAGDLLSTDPHWAVLSGVILRSVERGRGITASLDGTELSRAPVESIVNHAIAFVQDSFIGGQGPQIKFLCDLSKGVDLQGSWSWERAFVNLFSNAVRAMPEGGTIQVRAAMHEEGLEIVIRDEGEGIAPEVLRDLFKPHVSTRSSGGLGLHIVQTVVHQAGGQIRAANRTDSHGAEFTISIPAGSLER